MRDVNHAGRKAANVLTSFLMFITCSQRAPPGREVRKPFRLAPLRPVSLSAGRDGLAGERNRKNFAGRSLIYPFSRTGEKALPGTLVIITVKLCDRWSRAPRWKGRLAWRRWRISRNLQLNIDAGRLPAERIGRQAGDEAEATSAKQTENKKQFGFRPKRLKNPNSWNTFALLRLSPALLRLPKPLAECSLAWIVVQVAPALSRSAALEAFGAAVARAPSSPG